MENSSKAKTSSKTLDKIISVIAILMVVYHMVMTQFFLELPVLWQNTHLAFAFVVVFLTSLRSGTRRWRLLTVLLLVLSLVVTAYVKLEYDRLTEYVGWPTFPDTVIGTILILLALEGGRRAQGLVFTIIALAFLGYALLGQYLPYPLWHAPYAYERLVNMLTLGFSGIYGSMLSISAKYIFLFMLFGGILEASGAADSFMPLANTLGRRLAGGPAHTAVVSSALVGMVTGSGMANVAITGAFTIPTMKKSGYTPELAGAVEAVASTGGQVMPPVMGAAAFVMVGFTGIPYSRIMLAAIIPAIFYYLSLAIGVELSAKKGRYSVPPQEIDWKMIWLRLPVFVIPLGVLTVLLLMGHTPMFTAFYAVVSVMGVSLLIGAFYKEARIPLRRWIQGAVDGAISGARIGLGIACIGIVVGVVTFSGLGPKFTVLIRMLSGGNIPLALFLTMILALILGCGIPVTAAYILVAVAVVPGLVRMGVDLLAVHFFAFYYSCIGAVSPPIAGACVVAAGISGGSYLKTGVKSMELVAVGFIVPYLCVWNPFMLWYPNSLTGSAIVLISILLGTLSLQVTLHNQYFLATNLLERLLFLIATLGLFGFAFAHDYLYVTIGLLLFGLLTLVQWRRKKRLREAGGSEGRV